MIETIQSYDYLITRLNSTTKHLKAHHKILDKPEHKYLFPFYEKAMYIAISLTDLIVGLKYLDVSRSVNNEYEANYFARNVAHMSYELINHQDKIIGEEIAKITNETIGPDPLKELKNIIKKLRLITSHHFNCLKGIRNNLYGHRIENGSTMAKSMLEIDNRKIYKIGDDIFKVYFELLQKYVILISKL
ncbi:hypothetical protein [Desulfosediminicola ganghwensis]|uniref:hypothetical protein n=1 Tax=Desulfosediminicola ganghwensis TaxID=2569540 RepID=UPI0010AB798E|nr:hypothetical protein [Desulfosediminicola ganghwensis]